MNSKPITLKDLKPGAMIEFYSPAGGLEPSTYHLIDVITSVTQKVGDITVSIVHVKVVTLLEGHTDSDNIVDEPYSLELDDYLPHIKRILTEEETLIYQL